MISFDEFWPHPQLAQGGSGENRCGRCGIGGGLADMENMLKKFHPHLFVEIHPLHLKKCFHSSADEVLRFLTEKHNYKLMPVDADSLRIQDDNVTVWGD